MVRKKKSGMVNALIIANAILAVIIGGVIWMLASKNSEDANMMTDNSTPSKMETVSSNNIPASNSATKLAKNGAIVPSNSDGKKLQALQRQLQIEKQKAKQVQDQERKKAADLAKQLKDEKRRAEEAIATAKKKATEQQAELQKQLAQQKQNLSQQQTSADTAKLNQLRDELNKAKSEADVARKQLLQEKEQAELLANNAKKQAAQQKQAIAMTANQAQENNAAELAKAKAESEKAQADEIAAIRADAEKQIAEEKRIIELEKQAISAQLKAETERLMEIEESKKLADEENQKLIEKLRTEMQARQALAAKASTNQQQVSNSNAGSSSQPQSLVAAIESAVSKASQADQDYIQALSGNVSPFIKTKSQRKALSKVGTEEVDYFNRIQVENTKENNTAGELISQVDQLLVERDQQKQQKVENKEGQDEQVAKKDKDYLASLNPLAEQRSSESRFITVKRGDTLSNIADRAYGDWRLYNRIFAANPQILTNPNLIFPGQVLRVPL